MHRDKIIEIFVNVDDFCKEIIPEGGFVDVELIRTNTTNRRNQ